MSFTYHICIVHSYVALTSFACFAFIYDIRTALYIVGFTKIGFGTSVFYYIEWNLSYLNYYIASSIVGFSFLLFLFDVQHWSSDTGNTLRNVFFSLLVIAAMVFGILIASDHPYGPIAVFVIVFPFYLAAIKYVIYKTTPNRDFIYWLSGPLFLVSIVTMITWIVWTLWRNENEWNIGVALNEAEASGCDANFESYPDCDLGNGQVCFNFDTDTNTLNFDQCADGELCQNVFEECYNAFIIWVGPFLASMGLLFLSFFASFLRGDGTPDQEASKFLKLWVFLLFSMWVTASLAGAGTGVSTTLMALTLALSVASAVFVNIAFNAEERKEQMDAIVKAANDKYGGWIDVFRGLLVVTCAPVFMIYLVISFIIQRIRSLTFWCYTSPSVTTQSLRNVAGEGWFTVEGRRIIRMISSWNISKIMTYALYWGLLFMVMFVILSQYVLVFLSWVIQEVSDMSIGAVTGILVAVGMSMFLLPPVPGVPIYFTLGIVMIPVGRESFGIVGVIVYSMAISLALKLCACTVQQKVFGGMLKQYVSIRQMVGINSDLIRAMRLVLSEPGIGIAKVSILVGGPDWPTSVLCGIMNLDLLPVLVGTLPIVFLILPTLLSGSFTYMKDMRDETGELEFPWAGTMATVFTTLTAIVQFGSMVVATFYIDRVMGDKSKQDQLNAFPIDEEVKRADEKDEAKREAYEDVSHWDNLPWWAKLVLSLSLVCMTVSCYLFTFFAGYCFRDYQITYTIKDNLDGDWTTLVKPLGIVANLIFLVSIVLMVIFSAWANVSTHFI